MSTITEVSTSDADQKEQKDAQKSKESEEEEENGSNKFEWPEVKAAPGEHALQFSYSLWFSRRSPGNKTSSANYEQNIKIVGSFASVEQFWMLYSHLARPCDLTSSSDYHLFKLGIKPMWEDSANKKGGKWIVRLRKGLASRLWENLILAMLGEQFMVGDEICGAVVSIRFAGESLLLMLVCFCQRTTLKKKEPRHWGLTWALFAQGLRRLQTSECLLKGYSIFFCGKSSIMSEDEVSHLINLCEANTIGAMTSVVLHLGDESSLDSKEVSDHRMEDIISIWNRTSSEHFITNKIRDTLKRVLNLPPNTILEYKTHTDSIKDNSSFRNTDVFMR